MIVGDTIISRADLSTRLGAGIRDQREEIGDLAVTPYETACPVTSALTGMWNISAGRRVIGLRS